MFETANGPVDEMPPIEILSGRPPNFDAIARVLPAAHKSNTIFTYGHIIYVADGKPLPGSLIAHETVHVQQQWLAGRDEWWDRYLHDIKFRFQQELAAHRMEYIVAMKEGNRQARRRAEKTIAQRLAGPLYGKVCSVTRAKELICGAGVTLGNIG